MTQKNIILLVLVLIVLGGIVYFATANEAQAPIESAVQTPIEQAETSEQGSAELNAACEGALAYMSFPDGASADAFVAECKDGKHPEVLNQNQGGAGVEAEASL